MPTRNQLALRCSCLALWLVPVACTKGGGLVDGFASSSQGHVSGADTGDDDDDDGGDDDSITGPLDDDGGDGAPASTDDGGAPPAGEGDCCEGQKTPGCGDPIVAQCVCAQDAFCCDSVWDDLCASLVVENGCGICDGADDPGTGGPADDGGAETGTGGGGLDDGGAEAGSDGGALDEGGGAGVGDCCLAHPASGCDDADVQQCVCATDDYCCTTAWDDTCVGEVDSLGCGSCGGGTDGGGTDGGGTDGGGTDGGAMGAGECCAVQPGPGCADADIESCVCAADDYCCATQWDDICVGEVDQLGCGVCEAGTDGGAGDGGAVHDCCEPHDGTGCTDAAIESCVCAADDYCCTTAWDDICAGEVDSLACGSCG